MIYLLYGEEEFLIEEEINNILIKNKIDKLNVSKYNLEEDDIKGIIDDACTISLFDENKTIILNNFEKVPKQNEKSLEEFERYINNIDANTNLIITATTLDDRKKLTKLLKKVANTKEFNKSKNIRNTVKKMFDDYRIDYDSIDLLIKMSGTNLRILNQEAIKLKTYKEDKIITKEDVISLASYNDTEDIFDLINYIVNKEKNKAFMLYQKLIKNQEEPIKIIISLANQFRLIYQSKELYKKGMGQDQIAKKLNIHPYRIKLALEKSKNYSSKILLDYLLKLANLDYKIKNGQMDKNLALELFILEN